MRKWKHDNMKTFNDIWQLLSPKVEYANRMKACYELWISLTENQQDTIFDAISEKLAKGKFVDYNPLFAIKNHCQQRSQILSFNDYYNRYGTTEERDGRQMENPTGNQVIYVRHG